MALGDLTARAACSLSSPAAAAKYGESTIPPTLRRVPWRHRHFELALMASSGDAQA